MSTESISEVGFGDRLCSALPNPQIHNTLRKQHSHLGPNNLYMVFRQCISKEQTKKVLLQLHLSWLHIFARNERVSACKG